MNEVDGSCNVFDTSGDCVGLKDVNAGLAVFIDGGGIDGLGSKANKLSNILKGNTTLDTKKDTAGFTVSGVICYTLLLLHLPVNTDTKDQCKD